jgi:hypothetical protein
MSDKPEIAAKQARAEKQARSVTGRKRRPKSLVQFFRESPLVGVELHLERERDPGRQKHL